MKPGILVLHALVPALIFANPRMEDNAVERARQFAILAATEREEPEWETTILPEYWHPRGNGSGLPGRNPPFLPAFHGEQGLFLFTSLEVGQVLSGTSPWDLDGKGILYCVELRFLAVAEVSTQVKLLPKARFITKFYAMALDPADGKLKFVDSFPNRASFYEIPYFLKSWEKIVGKGNITNIPEVRDKLLALVAH